MIFGRSAADGDKGVARAAPREVRVKRTLVWWHLWSRTCSASAPSRSRCTPPFRSHSIPPIQSPELFLEAAASGGAFEKRWGNRRAGLWSVTELPAVRAQPKPRRRRRSLLSDSGQDADLFSFSIAAIVCINQGICAESFMVGMEQMLARRRPEDLPVFPVSEDRNI